MKGPCQCRLCEDHRRILAVLVRNEPAELRAEIRDLEERLANAEFELEVDEAILDGSWPSAREYAEKIFRKVAMRE
jgi:hypothetical protein